MKKSTVDSRYMARIYIQQARCTKFAGWRETLRQWAIKHRTAGRVKAWQGELFA